MALSSAKRLSQYGAVVRDSSRVTLNAPLFQAPTVCESTVAQLIDKKTDEQLFIVGTTNLSTRLAYRTKKLIEAYKPDAVLVQASDVFHEASRAPAASQEELTQQLEAQQYQTYLKSEGHLDFSLKSALYLYRRTLMGMFVHHTLRTPSNWRAVFTPGLEMKYALDYADSNKAPIFYAGEEFNAEAHLRLMHIPGFDVIWPFLNYHLLLNTSWRFECLDMGKLLQMCELKDLCEQHFHKDTMAWWVRFFATMLPKQKESLIDRRDEDMFISIEKKMKGTRKLAVVNQWHMEGIERLWRKNHGLATKRPATHGAEDFPLKEEQTYMDEIDSDREKVEKITGAPMASSHRQLVPYNDESRSHYG